VKITCVGNKLTIEGTCTTNGISTCRENQIEVNLIHMKNVYGMDGKNISVIDIHRVKLALSK